MEEELIMTAKGLMEELILSIITNDDAKARVHFKYVSPEWMGMPGWYFWPKDKRGVYYIKLEDVLSKEGGLACSYSLYYYPHPDEEEFMDFAFLEQVARMSDIFSNKGVAFNVSCPCQGNGEHEEYADLKEGKGIPIPRMRESLNSWLFRIGSFYSLWKDGLFQEWGVEAQPLSQTWAVEDVTLPGEKDESQTVMEKQSIDRSLSTWALAEYFVVNFLSDLRILEFAYNVREKKIGLGPYTANKMKFSLAPECMKEMACL